MRDFVVFDHVCKTYQMGDVRIEALKDASFTIDEGEICVIVGQSLSLIHISEPTRQF